LPQRHRALFDLILDIARELPAQGKDALLRPTSKKKNNGPASWI